MAEIVKNVNMSTKKPEQHPATTVTAAAAIDDESITATGVTSHRRRCEGAYFCECCLWCV